MSIPSTRVSWEGIWKKIYQTGVAPDRPHERRRVEDWITVSIVVETFYGNGYTQDSPSTRRKYGLIAMVSSLIELSVRDGRPLTFDP